MNDKEIRDRRAKKYVQYMGDPTGDDYQSTITVFKDGWDAARVNDKERKELQAKCQRLQAQVEKLFSDYWKLKLERKEDLGKD